MDLNRFYNSLAKIHKNIYAAIVSFIYSILFIFSYSKTILPSYEKIPLMDGNQYLKILEYFNNTANTVSYSVNFPFNGRILYFWMASLFPESFSSISIFIVLNYFFGLFTLLMLLKIWDKLFIPLPYSFLVLVYLCLHWSGIIRQYMIDPVGVDLPYLFFLSIFLYMTLFDQYKYLFLLAILATATKEAILPFIIVLLLLKLYEKKNILLENKKITFRSNLLDDNIKKITLALLLAVFTKITINFYFPADQENWKNNSIVTILKISSMVVKEPIHLLNWLMGILLFYGAFLYPFTSGILNIKYRSGKNGELLFFAVLGLLLGLLGGGDHTRISFLAFPFIFTFVLLYLKTNKKSHTWIFYFLPALYYTKCWLYLPTPTENWELFALWYPEYSHPKLFIPELLLGIISIIVLYFYSNKKVPRLIQ